ncbi:bifunctional [glutamate--ammonia ligase]-adenylyl-L-tyrosine phosphorylase/[glutamate--ammonia-ligase] adenylyltransferase [Pseudoxanthomonas composti]|uniref:Bifunctional glutamine synthetase adenylyltransferase/adenylyl-removing enzyme n=2 Tax=Pseudoxanthomonas composti TaxID=2137479 RepID=A0A4Q1JTZ8_9GAMM|nr:bifunctional [glutamate--ammonia ligase]-adenylyl-L-tyrosine phosphorylase/[glutamate--ammonia-ligase] adenylyltransferase [Pseudoxanthomonas composti]
MHSPSDPGARALQRLAAALPSSQAMLDSTPARQRIERLALASDFAIDTCVRQPALLPALLSDASAPWPAPTLQDGEAFEAWQAKLRRYRTAESTRLIWRDVIEQAPVEEILAGTTALAETCLRLGLAALEETFAQRHGVVRAGDGSVQRLVVFGLGKLGGGELNFSSDIDLVYAYPQSGQSDGARALAAEDYFARLGQRLAVLLDAVTADGFCHRVDLRLRPFGSAGRVALSFAAMDHYFQREGRDWERYAWLKARAVAGDIAAGEAWLESLRPFVYRRYLDFTALDGLRSMKAAIAAEVARRELSEDIKRGSGGIREIEFLAQALQLVHGGREAALRERRLLPALRKLAQARLIQDEDAQALAQAYGFLRKLENRLQMMADAQVHAPPPDAQLRSRMAQGLDYPDWEALQRALDAHKQVVNDEFVQLLAQREEAPPADALVAYWMQLAEGGDAAPPQASGFDDAQGMHGLLRDFARSQGVRDLSDAARARLDRVLPALLHAAVDSAQPDAAARRALALLKSVLRRASYLALLDEAPSALARLVDVVSRSAWLAERLTQYPLLLDELLDARIAGPMPTQADMARACQAALGEDDPEIALRQLNETRLALSFRIALATLDARQPAEDSARQLAWLADEVVKVVLALAQRDLERAHGRMRKGGFAIIGYGSLGGLELGFGSDLDLVFLFDAPAGAASDGARALEAERWYPRLAQKVMALLGTVTAAGRLYDIDVRLRPEGSQGALVSSLASYRDYQAKRAWTWEHQALVRARAIAGDAGLCAQFQALRAQVLATPRQADTLRQDVVQMRARMRAELDRSDAARFDLKQGAGGLVDLEFLLQWMVLAHADQHPALLESTNTEALIATAQAQSLVSTEAAACLGAAHAVLLQEGLACTLDRRPRVATRNAAIEQARDGIGEVARQQGLHFSPQAG